jgi:hypothetical protein
MPEHSDDLSEAVVGSSISQTFPPHLPLVINQVLSVDVCQRLVAAGGIELLHGVAVGVLGLAAQMTTFGKVLVNSSV